MLDPAKVRRIQARVGETADGSLGPRTLDAILRTLNACGEFFERLGIREDPIPANPPSEPAASYADERSERNLATVLPPVRTLARRLIAECWQTGMIIRVIDGTRTYEQQAKLYAQGRTTSGPIVTNAPPGHSNHNFALAFDIGIFSRDGRYLPESPSYTVAGAIAKRIGLTWGGDWRRPDEPHFELRPPWARDMSEAALLAELRARTAAGKPILT